MMTPENLPGFETSIRIVVAISMIIGFLVIFQSMYTAIMERTREIGNPEVAGGVEAVHRECRPAGDSIAGHRGYRGGGRH